MPSSYDSALLEAEDLLGTEGGADARLPIPLLPAPAPARPGRSPLLGALRRPLRTLDRFVRLHFLGFSTMLVLLGVASVAAEPGWIQLAGILAVAFCFHNFAYVLNDVIDLPVDRSHPARQDDYLVRGTIRPWQALAFALLQIPLAAGIHAFLVAGASSAGKPPLLVLLAGFGLMAVYDLWGKSCPVPPLTDLAQGLGWASLALYGAMAMGGPPNVLTWTAVAMGTGFILLINGVHGGLRDLSNDLDRGRRTTAIFFGSRPLPPEGAPSVNPGLVAFSMAAQVALIAVHLLPLVRNEFAYSPLRLGVTGAAVLLVDIACVVWMIRVYRTGSPTWERDFRLHLFFLLLAGVVLFAPFLEPRILFPFLFLFFWPLVFHRMTWKVVGATWRRIRAAAGLRSTPRWG